LVRKEVNMAIQAALEGEVEEMKDSKVLVISGSEQESTELVRKLIGQKRQILNLFWHTNKKYRGKCWYRSSQDEKMVLASPGKICVNEDIDVTIIFLGPKFKEAEGKALSKVFLWNRGIRSNLILVEEKHNLEKPTKISNGMANKTTVKISAKREDIINEVLSVLKNLDDRSEVLNNEEPENIEK
jgi:hypothetical protein